MAQNITLLGASYTAVPAVTLPKTGGGTASFTDVTDTTATASDVASGKYFYTAAGVRTQGTNSGGGGGASIDTKTVTASNRPSSLSFTSMKGEPIAWCLKATFTMTSSSSTYYYVDSMRYNGTNTTGRLFRMGSTRQTENVTSGYSFTYSGTTLTITSSGNRTTSPGCFYNGSYELVYVY